MQGSRRFLRVGERGKISVFVCTVVVVFVLDQLSKIWVRTNSPQIELLPGFLDLVRVENPGSAFGLFANQTFLLIVTSMATLLVILLFLHCLTETISLGVTLCLALILGGAVGNLIDRIRFGYVTDFISIHLLDLFHWPVFNIADACITVGVLALFFSFTGRGYSRKSRT